LRLALFAEQGPAVATALLAFFNQMLFVQSRIAMLDIFALAFGLFGVAAFMHGFRKQRPQPWFALAGLVFGLSTACKWSGLFPLAVCIVIVAVIRLMQGWRTQFADGTDDDWYRPDLWPDFRYTHFAACLLLIPALVYLATFVPLYGLSFIDILEAQRKIFGDNTTAAIAGHTYMSGANSVVREYVGGGRRTADLRPTGSSSTFCSKKGSRLKRWGSRRRVSIAIRSARPPSSRPACGTAESIDDGSSCGCRASVSRIWSGKRGCGVTVAVGRTQGSGTGTPQGVQLSVAHRTTLARAPCAPRW